MKNKKTRKRTSVIWTILKKDLQKILDSSYSIKGVLSMLGYNPVSGNHRTLNERIKIENLSLKKFNLNKKKWREEHMKNINILSKYRNEDVFIENSKYCRGSLKMRIIKQNLLKYVCGKCGNSGIHNGRDLSLQLDHLNGISDDNRIENLRFLCPNCHSQTATYSGKKNKKNYKCGECKSKISRQSKTRLCKSCYMKKYAKRKVENRPSKEEILKMKETMSMCAIGRKYGVSDSAIRKWLK